MSERGSFCTEYVDCRECFKVLREVLESNDKFLKGVVIPSWGTSAIELPIIAGKIGGHYAGEELDFMRFELAPKFQDRLCHPVRIAVIPESGEAQIMVFGEAARTKSSESEQKLEAEEGEP